MASWGVPDPIAALHSYPARDLPDRLFVSLCLCPDRLDRRRATRVGMPCRITLYAYRGLHFPASAPHCAVRSRPVEAGAHVESSGVRQSARCAHLLVATARTSRSCRLRDNALRADDALQPATASSCCRRDSLEERTVETGLSNWSSPSVPLQRAAFTSLTAYRAPSALSGAIEDALAQYGVRCDELPLTPRKVRELVRAGEKR